MKELLLQRLEPFQRLPEEDQPQLSFVFKKWHAELERKAAAREEDVGANSLDLEACLIKLTSAIAIRQPAFIAEPLPSLSPV